MVLVLLFQLGKCIQMKLINRDKVMLFFLILVIGLWSYYNFLVKPQHNRIEELKQIVAQYEGESITHQDFLIERKKLDEDLIANRTKIANLKRSFFINLDYGDVISVVHNLVSIHEIELLSLEIGSRSKVDIAEEFQSSSEEISDEMPIGEKSDSEEHEESIDTETNIVNEIEECTIFEKTTVSISFVEDFDTLFCFLKEIEMGEKLIILDNFDMRATEANLVETSLDLIFYSASMQHDNAEIAEVADFLIDSSNPFAFIDDSEQVMEDSYDQSSREESVPIIQIGKNRVLLSDFEEANYRFLSKNRNISGIVSRDIESVRGEYSLRVEYDFSRAEDEKVAVILFTGEEIIIPLITAEIGVWIYSDVETEHAVELLIVDNNTNKHILQIADSINWTGWQQKKIEILDDVSYPIRITAIKIKSTNEQDASNNILLFDKFELIY